MSAQRTHGLRSRLSRRFMRRLGWLVGAPLAIFRFLRREIPIVEIDPARRGGVPLGHRGSRHRARAERDDGVGPVVHRLYSATIRCTEAAGRAAPLDHRG